jgi:hypothetical protein
LSAHVRVAVVAPAWVTYAPQSVFTGHELDIIPTTASTGWRLTPELVAQHLGDAKRRLLIFNAPSNPTGTTYTRAQLHALAAALRQTNTLVVADEIYADLCYGDDFVSLAQELPESTIVCSGISKDMAAGMPKPNRTITIAPPCHHHLPTHSLLLPHTTPAYRSNGVSFLPSSVSAYRWLSHRIHGISPRASCLASGHDHAGVRDSLMRAHRCSVRLQPSAEESCGRAAHVSAQL